MNSANKVHRSSDQKNFRRLAVPEVFLDTKSPFAGGSPPIPEDWNEQRRLYGFPTR
jgi:hypothetical protein